MLSRIMLCLRCIRWVKPASQLLEDPITCKIEAKSLSKFANFVLSLYPCVLPMSKRVILPLISPPLEKFLNPICRFKWENK